VVDVGYPTNQRASCLCDGASECFGGWFVGFGFVALISVAAVANANLHFLKLDIRGFVIGVSVTGTVLLPLWVIWLKPSWLKEIISGRFRLPTSS
jgi:hypothetical protein